MDGSVVYSPFNTLMDILTGGGDKPQNLSEVAERLVLNKINKNTQWVICQKNYFASDNCNFQRKLP